MPNLKPKIEQERPFSSAEEEALVNLLRSCDLLNRAVQRSTRGYGITATQYKALRILQAAQPAGLKCAAIGRRMIAAEPDITRLLNRLKGLRLVRQRRDRHDRRMVWTQITDAGLELLDKMEPVMRRVPAELLGHMTAEDLAALNRLLELARARSTAAENREGAFDAPPAAREGEDLPGAAEGAPLIVQ